MESTITTTTANLANVPHPAGAVQVHDWMGPRIGEEPDGSTDCARYFLGGSWVVERNSSDTDICIEVDGIQHGDGRVERVVVVDGDVLTVDQARQLAAALIAAADEVETMNGYDMATVER